MNCFLIGYFNISESIYSLMNNQQDMHDIRRSLWRSSNKVWSATAVASTIQQKWCCACCFSAQLKTGPINNFCIFARNNWCQNMHSPTSSIEDQSDSYFSPSTKSHLVDSVLLGAWLNTCKITPSVPKHSSPFGTLPSKLCVSSCWSIGKFHDLKNYTNQIKIDT